MNRDELICAFENDITQRILFNVNEWWEIRKTILWMLHNKDDPFKNHLKKIFADNAWYAPDPWDIMSLISVFNEGATTVEPLNDNELSQVLINLETRFRDEINSIL
jgi:hypothetical protein